jgi:asparagine synthase (glutamine-hydrolysing)
MCGIVGVLNLADRPPVDMGLLCRMLGTIRHRGPDEFGIYRDPHVGLGNARLSILDLSSGQQPIGNEDGTLWIVYNGEAFNYVELRPELEARGHRFCTNTDTEVILHLYEDHGPGCLAYLNGQYAIAIWDARERTLLLARDRMGIRPLFYTVVDGQLLFGSEIKALLAYPGARAEIDPASLDQIFTFWSTPTPCTVFRNLHEIPPGHYLLAREGQFALHSYWSLDLTPDVHTRRTGPDYLDEFENLLIDATRIRLRADVPVGAYLSGGLDSSVTAAIIRKYTANRLDTFSIAFEDPQFDESQFQRQMAAALGTHHRVTHCTSPDIGAIFPDVIWHTETPVLRTAPAPMFLLSQLVRDHGLKVVLTGEGADEVLAGYGIFKEMRIRRFWARDPSSQMRPLLLQRLYPDISGLGGGSSAYLTAFFKQGLEDTNSPYYSHAIRWATTARTRSFLLRQQEADRSDREGYPAPPSLPPAFYGWSHLAQAQYLEMTIFLSQYLLSSQGDRMAMAHSVEGRFPFLDYRVVEFCNRLPAGLKLHGLTEKWLLKQLGRQLVPTDIWQRPKQPYRAPIHHSFFHENAPSYVQELLSEPALRDSGLFNPAAVSRLQSKAQKSPRLSEVDSMALVGILSSQLVYHHFVKAFRPPSLRPADRIKVVDACQQEETGTRQGAASRPADPVWDDKVWYEIAHRAGAGKVRHMPGSGE